jgi:RecA/RadA recombinase
MAVKTKRRSKRSGVKAVRKRGSSSPAVIAQSGSLAALIGKMNRGLFVCSEPIPSDTITLPTRSPLFNLFLSERANGGIPLGRVIEIFGAPDMGKTSLLQESMVAFQNAGGIVLLHDSDFKFNRQRAELRGWNPERTVYIPDKSIEDVLDRVEEAVTYLRRCPGYEAVPILFAWDSAPSTPLRDNLPAPVVVSEKAEKKKGKGIADIEGNKKPSIPAKKKASGGMAEAARVLWDKLSRRLVGFLSDQHVTLIATSPTIAMIAKGAFAFRGPQQTTALGGSIKTQATLRIKVWRSGLFKYTTDSNPIGVYFSLQAVKHHLRLLGGQQVTLAYLFETGFSAYYDAYNYLLLSRAINPEDGSPWASAAGGHYRLGGVKNSFAYRDVPAIMQDPEVWLRALAALESAYLSVSRVSSFPSMESEEESDDD